MCGIVGYVGHRAASEFLLQGLRRLEYRGYDSAGLAILGSGILQGPAKKLEVPSKKAERLQLVKAVGRIHVLAEKLAAAPLAGCTGIGHTALGNSRPAHR